MGTIVDTSKIGLIGLHILMVEVKTLKMGQAVSNGGWVRMYHDTMDTYFRKPDEMPRMREGPSFDPQLGFGENGRKERVSLVTEEEMDAAGLAKEQRDYCAHKLIPLLQCKRDNFPWVQWYCHEFKHAFDHCQHDDYVLRMKEFERERRLLQRAKRKGILDEHERPMKDEPNSFYGRADTHGYNYGV